MATSFHWSTEQILICIGVKFSGKRAVCALSLVALLVSAEVHSIGDVSGVTVTSGSRYCEKSVFVVRFSDRRLWKNRSSLVGLYLAGLSLLFFSGGALQ